MLTLKRLLSQFDLPCGFSKNVFSRETETETERDRESKSFFSGF